MSLLGTIKGIPPHLRGDPERIARWAYEQGYADGRSAGQREGRMQASTDPWYGTGHPAPRDTPDWGGGN